MKTRCDLAKLLFIALIATLCGAANAPTWRHDTFQSGIPQLKGRIVATDGRHTRRSLVTVKTTDLLNRPCSGAWFLTSPELR